MRYRLPVLRWAETHNRDPSLGSHATDAIGALEASAGASYLGGGEQHAVA
jgi:hypothetical protein